VPGHPRITGTDEFHKVARRLKEAGNGKLTREMSRAMRAAAQPAESAMKQEVQTLNVSRRGGASARGVRAGYALRNRKKATENARQKAFRNSGLRSTVARSVRTKVSTTARSSSVRIRAQQSLMPPSQRKLPRLMNKGNWRKPLFGNRRRWYEQTTPPAGWFDRPAEVHGPRIRERAVDVIDDINRKIVAG
jgi:hypothetical protein